MPDRLRSFTTKRYRNPLYLYLYLPRLIREVNWLTGLCVFSIIQYRVHEQAAQKKTRTE